MFIPNSVFVDTNVFLDDILVRQGKDNAKRILELGVKRLIRLCLSSLSVVNISYIARKAVSAERMKEIIDLYLRYFVILPDTDMDLYDSIRSGNPDFEDAMQISCARREGCLAIITSNKKHFTPYTDIPVFTPEEFLVKITE